MGERFRIGLREFVNAQAVCVMAVP